MVWPVASALRLCVVFFARRRDAKSGALPRRGANKRNGWLKVKQEWLRRCWPRFPLPRATHFGISVF